MKVLVFEYNAAATGHRIPYARLVAEAAQTISGVSTIACFPEVLQATGGVEEYFPADDPIELLYYPLKVSNSAIQHCRNSAEALWNQIETHQPDYILLPTADSISTIIATNSIFKFRKRKIPIDMLLMRLEHLAPGVSTTRRFQKWIEWKFIKHGPWNRIMLLDPLAWRSVSKSVTLCPDPVPVPVVQSKKAAREELALPSDGSLVVSIGNQNEAKGADLLLNLFADPQPKNYSLLLAGPMSTNVKEVYQGLKSKNVNLERLIVWDRYLSEVEFQKAVIAADVVAAPYRRTERPSGIVCRAVAWNRPLVASNHGWPKWACETLKAGIAIDTLGLKRTHQRAGAGDRNGRQLPTIKARFGIRTIQQHREFQSSMDARDSAETGAANRRNSNFRSASNLISVCLKKT